MKDDVELVARTKTFALRVVKLFVGLPKTTEGQVLGKQLLRSGTSVGANYREAQRARSKAEFIAKIGDCLKELDETAYWFELLTESGIVPAPRPASRRVQSTPRYFYHDLQKGEIQPFVIQKPPLIPPKCLHP